MKKGFCILGIIFSLVIVLLGILLLTGAISVKPESSYLRRYDSGFAVFGGDFYTHVNNNAAEAVGLIRVTAGILVMSIGALGFCLFGAFLGIKEIDPSVQMPKPTSKPVAGPKAPKVPATDELPDL